MRTALLLSSLLVTACTVGQVSGSNNSVTDAGAKADSGAGTDAISSSACVDRRTPADPIHPHLAGGTSNAGLSCVVAGCHQADSLGTGATGFQFAGTVYKPDGTTPSAGATIRVKSAAGLFVDAYTDAEGNFSISAGALKGAGNGGATTLATACPTVTPMVTQLAQGSGDCNSCHRTGGVTTRITLAGQ